MIKRIGLRFSREIVCPFGPQIKIIEFFCENIYPFAWQAELRDIDSLNRNIFWPFCLADVFL